MGSCQEKYQEKCGSAPAGAAASAGASRLPQAAFIAVVVIVLLGGVLLRASQIATHFTHIDDIGVAATIFEARRDIAGIEDLRAIIHNPRLRQHDSLKMGALRQLDRSGALAPTFAALSSARDMLAVPLRWSYAPVQYLVTPGLISESAGYRTTLAAGRAPSAIFSILAMAAAAFCAWRLRRDDVLAPGVALAVMALSLELFSFSLHMSNYAAGVFAAAVLMAIVSADRPAVRPVRSGLALAAMLWLLVHLSYQVLLLVPAAMAALAVAALRRDGAFDRWRGAGELVRRILRSPMIRMLVIAGLAFGLALIPSYLLLMTAVRPITWNAGPNNEFVFSWVGGGSFVGFLGYALAFTLSNLWQMFAAMVSPVPASSPLYVPIAGIMLALFLNGVVSLLRTPAERPAFVIGLFITLAFATTLALACAGLIALSPTRHALIFLPLCAVGIGRGAAAALQFIASPAPRWWIAAASLAALSLVAAVQVAAQTERRRDPFDEGTVAALLDSTGSRTAVEYGQTYNLDLMPAVQSRAAIFNERNLNFPWLAGRLPAAPGNTLFVSQSMPLTADGLKRLTAAINATLPDKDRRDYCFDAGAIVHRDERPLAQSFEVSPATDSGQNGYFVYVIAPSPPGAGC